VTLRFQPTPPPEATPADKPATTRVVLADDHTIVRQGLRVLLEARGLAVVGEASDGRQAVQLVRERSPDVAVLDLFMPVMNGLEAAQEIHQCCPKTRTIVLTANPDDANVLKALRAGVRGCLEKTHSAQELLRAIEEVLRGGVYLSPSVSRAVVDAYRSGSEQPADPLTQRERQILQLMAEGKRTKEIADMLCISVRTVETHRGHIMEKLNIFEVAGLVRYAIRHGMTSL
jgi:DNA-binding NarL/FixJ family response regulator